jgi:hypothetical protein
LFSINPNLSFPKPYPTPINLLLINTLTLLSITTLTRYQFFKKEFQMAGSQCNENQWVGFKQGITLDDTW